MSFDRIGKTGSRRVEVGRKRFKRLKLLSFSDGCGNSHAQGPVRVWESDMTFCSRQRLVETRLRVRIALL